VNALFALAIHSSIIACYHGGMPTLTLFQRHITNVVCRSFCKLEVYLL
jgi:hypothetical protein